MPAGFEFLQLIPLKSRARLWKRLALRRLDDPCHFLDGELRPFVSRGVDSAQGQAQEAL